MTSENIIDKLFDLLDNWRNLPAYQLERRADIFFAVYLPDIIKKRFGVVVDYIIPEFPIRVGTISSKADLSNPNLSFKIDYLAISNASQKVYLVELKTDDGSRRDKQDWYLNSSKQKNIPSLVDGVLQIYNATNSKKKYDNLIRLLTEVGWIDSERCLNVSQNYEIEIVYIQPNPGDNKDEVVISFDDVRKFLSDRVDFLTVRFSESLEKWKVNPNK